jgi:hypothetical protein
MQDDHVFDDMVAQLNSTAKFKMARWGIFTGAWPQEGAYVNILRVQFMNDDRTANPDDEERQVFYRILLRYNSSDDNFRNKRLSNLEALIINMFHNKRIAGLTIPKKTRVYRGRPGKPTSTNEGATDLDGVFVYRVAPRDGLIIEGI